MLQQQSIYGRWPELHAGAHSPSAFSVAAILFFAATSTTLVAAPKEKCDTQAKAFVEVAKLFAKGKEKCDVDEITKLLGACVSALEPGRRYDDQEDSFYDRVEDMARYLDSHRVTCADITHLRKVFASACTVTRDEDRPEEPPRDDNARPLGLRLGRLTDMLWGLSKDKDEHCAPRHAILMSLLSATDVHYPRLTPAVLFLRRRQEGDPSVADAELSAVHDLLLARENEPLRKAVLDDLKRESDAAGIPEAWEGGEHAQRSLESKNNPREFNRHLQEFIRCCDKTLKGLPDFATGEKYFWVRFLRGVWNMVHTHGDEATRARMSAFVKGLREHFTKEGDAVTAKWLEEVMTKEPGKCPEVFVEIWKAAPVEKEENK